MADSRRKIRRMAEGRRSSSVLRRLGFAFEAVRHHIDRRLAGVEDSGNDSDPDVASSGSKRRGCEGGASPARRRRCSVKVGRDGAEGGAGG